MIDSRNWPLSSIQADDENDVPRWSRLDDEASRLPKGGLGITQFRGLSGCFGRALGGCLAELPVASADKDASPPVEGGRAFGSGGGGVGPA